jgi:hypothetical protein
MEHAAIQWDGAAWTLRDLNSCNGTRVRNTFLIGRTWRLAPGDELRFGDPSEVWCWLDGAPPPALATGSDGTTVEARNGLLLLPDEANPMASISTRAGQWELDDGSEVRAVEDGECVDVAGVQFQLELPSLDPAMSRTHTVEHQRLIGAAHLCLHVSLDQEHVAATFELPKLRRELGARSFNYMLLVLAKARQDDEGAGVPPSELGWIHVQDLARKLNTSVEAINVDIHRLRRSVEELGIFDNPSDVIERRRTVGQVRLGIGSVSLA